MHFALRRGSLLWAVALIACGGERPPAFVDRLPGAPGRPDELPEAPEPPLPCAPLSCETAGSGCGIVPDGCGGQLTCGECGVGQTCGGGGVPNVCGAPPVTPPPAPALPTWVRRLGGSQNDSGLAVTADADNNVYLAWSSVRRESSGAPPAPGGDERQAVSLSKYAPDGTLRWTREFPGPEVTHASLRWVPGGLYWMGNAVSGAVTLGGEPLIGGFVVRYTPSGDFLSQIRVGAFAYSFDVNARGEMIVSTVQPLEGGPETYAELFKFEADSDVAWSRKSVIEGSAFTEAAFDAAGNVLTAGTLGGPLEFNGETYGAKLTRTLLLLKLGPSGSTVWARQKRGVEVAQLALGRSNQGTGVVLGRFNGALSWAGTELVNPYAPGGEDNAAAFLLTLESDGRERWVRELANCPPEISVTTAFTLAVDPWGQVVFVCGARLTKYALSGALLWSRDLSRAGCGAAAGCVDLKAQSLTVSPDRTVLGGGERTVPDPQSALGSGHTDAVVFKEAP